MASRDREYVKERQVRAALATALRAFDASVAALAEELGHEVKEYDRTLIHGDRVLRALELAGFKVTRAARREE